MVGTEDGTEETEGAEEMEGGEDGAAETVGAEDGAKEVVGAAETVGAEVSLVKVSLVNVSLVKVSLPVNMTSEVAFEVAFLVNFDAEGVTSILSPSTEKSSKEETIGQLPRANNRTIAKNCKEPMVPLVDTMVVLSKGHQLLY